MVGVSIGGFFTEPLRPVATGTGVLIRWIVALVPALIVVALALFVAEALVTSYGALAISGIVCLVLGATMLVDSPGGFFFLLQSR